MRFPTIASAAWMPAWDASISKPVQRRTWLALVREQLTTRTELVR